MASNGSVVVSGRRNSIPWQADINSIAKTTIVEEGKKFILLLTLQKSGNNTVNYKVYMKPT